MNERPDIPAPHLRMLILPGWQDSGPDHWQSRWQRAHGWRRVEQADWQWPRRGDWMARLDDVLLEDAASPAVLVAHSLGCQLVAAWAAHSQLRHRVAAAFLVAPPDTERADMPPQLFNWRPMARQALPFASFAVVSTDDPYCTLARARRLVHDWGSACVEVGAQGHLNDASALGDWPEGWALLQGLTNPLDGSAKESPKGSSTIGPWSRENPKG